MLLVKITFLTWVISSIYFSLVKNYLKNDWINGYKWNMNKGFEKTKLFISIVVLVRWTLLTMSLIWFLFFR